MSSTLSSVHKCLLAGGAAVTLSLGLVACGDNQETDGGGGDTAMTAEPGAEGAGEGGAGGTAETGAEGAGEGGAGGTAETGAEGAGETGAEGETGADTTQVESPEGSMLEFPTAVAETAEAEGFGAPQTVEEGPNGETLVSYEGGNHIVHTEQTGAQPLVGMIGETWINEGGFDGQVGVPTAPEMENEDGNGWTQEFTNGSIAWTADENGEYSADIQSN